VSALKLALWETSEISSSDLALRDKKPGRPVSCCPMDCARQIFLIIHETHPCELIRCAERHAGTFQSSFVKKLWPELPLDMSLAKSGRVLSRTERPTPTYYRLKTPLPLTQKKGARIPQMAFSSFRES